MIKALPITVFLMTTVVLTAQEFREISTGAGYNNQHYVSLTNSTEHTVANNAWDIAFSVQGQTDGGIFINESAGSSMGVPQNSIALYNALTTDFNETIDPALLIEDVQLYNSELNWQNGAFNELRDTANPFDYGWGAYNPQTHQLAGSAVYAIQLRDGSYKKFQVVSLANGAYTFKYANLDGTDEVTATIAKEDHAGETLAYFSFATGSTVEVEPAGGFDLVFKRYITPLYDVDNDVYIPYAVTGILHGDGVQTAQANGVDPATVAFEGFQSQLNDSLDVIGHDWKYFSFTDGWVLPQDLVYFVKTTEDRVWKLHFVDFEGSSTGTAVYQSTDMGLFTNVTTPSAINMEVLTYPNPVTSQLTVALTTPQELAGKRAMLTLHNMAGVAVYQQATVLNGGFQVHQIEASQWPSGLYFVSLQTNEERIPLGNISKQ